MKFKFSLIFLSAVLLSQNVSVFADDDFNAKEAFKSYAAYDDSLVNETWKHYYVVSKSTDNNCKALFSEDKQLTDFIYESIDFSNCGIIVSQIRDGAEYFGLLDGDDYSVILPVKYKSVENYEVEGYIAEDEDGNKEYYIIKTPIIDAPNVSYKETDKLYILNSYEDLKSTLNPEPQKVLTPITGLDNCYVTDDVSGLYQWIVDKDGNKLVDMDFRKVDTKLSAGDTLVVWYPEGMNDSSAGVLNKDLKVIVPKKSYGTPEFIETNGAVYIKVTDVITGDICYYDINGNIVTEPKASSVVNEKNIDTSYSDWAKESIEKSIELGLVPENLQSNYTQKITRAEFCRLAIQTYIAKTKNQIDTSAKTPFTDVDDYYITNAYNMKIIAGVGNNKFAPDNNITRQEAAVMLNNLATALNVETDNLASEKFVDESYFADWAKSAIYSVVGMKSCDTYVMVGTGDGKFSPWMNYTREQAIATMLRLYNCEQKQEEVDDGYICFETDSFGFSSDSSIISISDYGKSVKKLVSSSEGELSILRVDDEYVYYCNKNYYGDYLARINRDGTDNKKIIDEENVHNLYIGKNNIYYIVNWQDDEPKVLVKTNMDGEVMERFELPPNNSSKILVENGNKVYISLGLDDSEQTHIYEYDSDEKQLVEKGSIDIPVFAVNSVSDGKNIYSKITRLVGESQPYDAYYLYKCDTDGKNQTNFNRIAFDNGDAPFIYNGYIYTTAYSNGYNIIRINSDGVKENVTHYPEGDYEPVEIIKIVENKIYYSLVTDPICVRTRVYSVNTDGSDTKLLYDSYDFKTDEN